MPIIMDGVACAKTLRAKQKEILENFISRNESVRVSEIRPKLNVIQVGDNPASNIYVRNKARACEEVGITFIHHKLDESITMDELENIIHTIQNDTTGILVQLPLPEHLNEDRVMSWIKPIHDVDGFTDFSMGSTFKSDIIGGNEACTPAGICYMLESYGIQIAGKHAVVVGRSNIVGKPMAAMLTNRNATVTLCHSHTENLENFTKTADILVSAVGHPNLITADMVKPGAVVIDVGTTRGEDGKLHGDVDFSNVLNVCSYITPVPGGVGPMTVAQLTKNVVNAFIHKNS